MTLKHAASSAAPKQGRRKLIQAGLTGAPLLMALKSTPVLAGNCRIPSGFSASGNLSQTNQKNCQSPFASVGEMQTFLANNPSLNVTFVSALGANAKGQDASYTLSQALAEGPTSINAKAAALFLGAPTYGPPTQSTIRDLWSQGVASAAGYTTGGYKTASSTWYETEVNRYFDYLLGTTI